MRRASFLTWHRRLALLFAPLLLLQALTGAVLLFHAPLAQMLYPVSGSADPAQVSQLVDAAMAAVPQARLSRLYLPETDRDTARVELKTANGALVFVALDPSTARVIATGGYSAFPLEAALQWHYSLMSGTIGLAVVLGNGIALLILSGTGLAQWWPANGRFAKALGINARMPGRVRLRQWHRSGGVLAALPLIFSAATGIMLAAPDLIPAQGATEPVFNAAPVQVDAAVSAAQVRFPKARLRDIRFPPADRLAINFFAPERNPRAVHVATVQLSTGQVLTALPAAQNNVLWMTVLPLHTGDSAGLIGRLILLIEALVLAALAISGPWMWWQARRLRK